MDVYCCSTSFFQGGSSEHGGGSDVKAPLGKEFGFLEKHNDIALMMLLNKAVIRL